MFIITGQEVLKIGKALITKNKDGLFHPPPCFEVFDCPYVDNTSRDCCCTFALAFANRREGEVLHCFACEGAKCAVGRNCDGCPLKRVLAHDIITEARTFLQQFPLGRINRRKRE